MLNNYNHKLYHNKKVQPEKGVGINPNIKHE